MPEGQVLEFTQVTKRFGAVTAVSDLSVRVEPGAVTGFLGPNGAGKTTSLRILLGQIRPTSGTATIGGASYSDLRHPLRTIGAVLEESAYRPRRTASRQLMLAAKANGIPSARVAEVLHLVGLQDDGDTRLGSYSLGMRQRLAVASALLGDPGVLVLDEPANGLDPEGIRWMRLLMRRLADEGRTVLVSSHVLSEIEQVADDVVVLSKGRAVHAGPISELADASGGAVVVDAENRAPLITALSAAKLDFDVLRSGVTVRDSDSAAVGAVAAEAGVALTMLQQRGPSLEEVFLDLVYGRRADSPRLDTSANRVAHASDPVNATAAADAAPGTAPDAPAAPAAPAETDAADADAAAEHADTGDAGAADAALVAGGMPFSGAAALVADGGAVAAAGAGYGAAPADTDDADDADEAVSEDSGTDPDSGADADTDADSGPEADAAADADAEAEAADSDADADADTQADAGADADSGAVDDADMGSDADTDSDTDTDADADAAQTTDLDAATATDLDAATATDVEADASSAADEDATRDHVDESASGAGTGAEDATDAGAATSTETDGADADTDSDAAAADDADIDAGTDGTDADDTVADDETTHSDETRPLILPLATEAVTLPSASVEPTFTELITGLPASVTTEGSENAAPATEAISIVTPSLSGDDDDDTVDDGDDDPRLAAMRTSLSAAASRFFDGPAPDYPYSSRAQRREESAEADADAATEGSDVDPSTDPASNDGDQGHQER
ncbi:ATP-binding cassette domain-containing protein [Microbacterium sp. Re1]|uniref:ATP-binding cassette domain-containing protein n=1 Tax=Microbacterium commune TaxID=2762219 RepID=A0ABR8W4V7_9MICO|nr:ATP-binding cassette domain-containing protein [Microbacterium commune]MBD8011998.1 ATP-binding cassette domain-containing protein [Microbacterium commune]